MKISADIKTKIRIEIEFDNLEEFFNENILLFRPEQISKVRDAFQRIILEQDISFYDLYEQYRKEWESSQKKINNSDP